MYKTLTDTHTLTLFTNYPMKYFFYRPMFEIKRKFICNNCRQFDFSLPLHRLHLFCMCMSDNNKLRLPLAISMCECWMLENWKNFKSNEKL